MKYYEEANDENAEQNAKNEWNRWIGNDEVVKRMKY